MHIIDMDTWPRKDHFNLFRTFNHPHFSMCANVDISKTLPYIKEQKHSFTIAIAYLIGRTANAIQEFRLRIRGDQVIEQEVVGQVLDPSENKVRLMLEEGSGIVRYKMKRKEALRKLDLTERDLLRVEDIVEEIGKQVRSLARQVGKARRHQRLFSEVKALETRPGTGSPRT